LASDLEYKIPGIFACREMKYRIAEEGNYLIAESNDKLNSL